MVEVELYKFVEPDLEAVQSLDDPKKNNWSPQQERAAFTESSSRFKTENLLNTLDTIGALVFTKN